MIFVSTTCITGCGRTLRNMPEGMAKADGWVFSTGNGWTCPDCNPEHGTQTALPFALETVRKDAAGFALASYYGSSSQNAGFPEPEASPYPLDATKDE